MNHSFTFDNGVNVLINPNHNFLQIKTEQLLLIADSITIRDDNTPEPDITLRVKIDTTSFHLSIRATEKQKTTFKKWLANIELETNEQ